MNYDVAIIGCGIAGMFAGYKIAKDHKDIKTIIFDLGRPPGKRKRALEGFGGCLPSSDGKLYMNDLDNISKIIGSRKTNAVYKQFIAMTAKLIDTKIIKDKSPNQNTIKRIKKYGFELTLNDYIQLYPKDIHIILKYIATKINESKNITTNFDTEIVNIIKENNNFVILSDNEEIRCKKLLICVGRSGWRWGTDLYNSFNLIRKNDYAKFGIRIECLSSIMKDFNKSNCSLISKDLEIGPLSWNGTVIPEDHIDVAISSFRSNEARWKSDKVSFNLIGNRLFKNEGIEQTNRIAQLTFILTNDRIIKERLSTIINKRSQLSIIPEYDWLSAAIETCSNIIPEIITKGYYHAPTILPLIPEIIVNKDMSTEMKNMFVAGESAGKNGILFAMLTGLIAAESVSK